MSEIRYCYHCHRGQPTITQPSGFATCATCGTDELGEVVDPLLTRTVIDAVPVPRYVTTAETDRSEQPAKLWEVQPSVGNGPQCYVCATPDVGYYLGRDVDSRSVYLCMKCANDQCVVKTETWHMKEGHRILVRTVPGEDGQVVHDAPCTTTETARSEVIEYKSPPRTYASIAADIAATVEQKQAAYGDSFGKAGAVLELLYPHGIPVEAYGDALAIVRVLDKLFRIATDRDALGENPWGDIAGYALLAVRRVEQDKGRA